MVQPKTNCNGYYVLAQYEESDLRKDYAKENFVFLSKSIRNTSRGCKHCGCKHTSCGCKHCGCKHCGCKHTQSPAPAPDPAPVRKR